jgi:hypothetical protein
MSIYNSDNSYTMPPYVMNGFPREKTLIMSRTSGKVANFSPTADNPRRKPLKVQHFQEPSDKLANHVALPYPVPYIVVSSSSWLGFKRLAVTIAVLPTSPGLSSENSWLHLNGKEEVSANFSG